MTPCRPSRYEKQVGSEAQIISPQRQPIPDTGDLSAYVPALRRYFSKRADVVDVDDFVQDVLLRMHIRSQHERGPGEAISNIEGYLFQVAASVLTDRARRDQVRQRSGHLALTDAMHPVEELTPERVLGGREDFSRLADALEEMPELTRDTFILHRFEEMSYDMIAQHLGLSIGTVGRHLMKALRFLAARGVP